MSQRHRARRLALQGLCCLDVRGPGGMEMVDAFLSDSKAPAETIASARRMLTETLADREKSDQLLIRHARRWGLDRLALVDRNILRLAACELARGRTPLKVVITEAMRLAQEFSTAESPRFINGVLDAIVNELGRNAGAKGGDAEDASGLTKEGE